MLCFCYALEAPSQDASRHLVLVAKTLQNVANGVEFKEKHMENLNVFIRMNNADVNNFFDQLSKLPTQAEVSPTEPVPAAARVCVVCDAFVCS